MKAQGTLRNNAIVATVMSNIGFHEFAGNNGIDLLCAAVGDRNVLELMLCQRGCSLGGEQSGHIIFLDDATTGRWAACRRPVPQCRRRFAGKKLSELAGDVPQYPQVLLNATLTGGNAAKDAIMSSAATEGGCCRQSRKRLGGAGRILVRPSGTEALIRVMVEAKTEETGDRGGK